jgi:hypothetical protein
VNVYTLWLRRGGRIKIIYTIYNTCIHSSINVFAYD